MCIRDRIDRIEIYWPQTGITQTIKNVMVNQHIKIEEGKNEYTILKLLPFKFNVHNDSIPHHHEMNM